MTIKSSAPKFLNELKAQLDARPAMSDVVVRTGPIGDTQGRNAIEMASIDAEYEWASQGTKAVEERFKLAVVIHGYGRGPDDEIAIRTARDGAFLIMDEVMQAIRDNPHMSGNVRQPLDWNYELDQGWTSSDRFTRIILELHIATRLRST